MNDIQIQNFISIARFGSFNKAEDALNTTKTALKKQMDSLESDLGFKLFIRTSKGVSLTNAGTLFYDRISEMYNEFEDLVQECRALDTHSITEIRIGMYTITNMINWYHAIEHASSYKIRLNYISGGHMTHEDNLNMLNQNKIDFLEYEDNFLIFERNFCFREIVQDHLCCIMKSDHPLAGKKSIQPQELKGCNLYCWSSISSATRGLMELSRTYNLNLQPHDYSFNNVLEICSSGNIYILSYNLAKKFEPLEIIPIDPPIYYHRGLVYKPEKEALLQELLQIAKPEETPSIPVNTAPAL